MDYVVFFGFVALVLGVASQQLRARFSLRRIEEASALSTAGNDREALRRIAVVRWIGPDGPRRGAWFVRMSAHANLGATAKSVRLAEGLLRSLADATPRACPLVALNAIIVTLINGGRYAAALAAGDRWSEEARERGREADPGSYVIVRINEAEALCNQARMEEALARLNEVRAAAADSPFALAGLRTLEAWILLQAGRIDDARAALEGADLSAIQPLYEPEVEYTRAALERDSGHLDAALRHARRGLAGAKRAASRRNGLFMVAGIRALQGDHAEARELFERGVHDPYRAQAGEGLARYARFLASLGERDAAERVRGMVRERDPEWRDPRPDAPGARGPA